MKPFDRTNGDDARVEDDRLDDLVHDWLQSTAVRMPAGVLEEVLVVAPTVRRARRPLPRRLRRSLSYAPIGALAAVVVLAVAFGPAIVSTLNVFGPMHPGPSVVPVRLQWDVASDFREGDNHQNPSADRFGYADVWSYEYSAGDAHDPEQYRLLPDFDGGGSYAEPGSGVSVSYLGRALGISPATTQGRKEPVIVSWRSPIEGSVHVVGQVIVDRNCDSGTGILFSIANGPAPLLSYAVPEYGARSFGLDTTVRQDDHLYFIVESGADPLCDWTTLYLTIVEDARGRV